MDTLIPSLVVVMLATVAGVSGVLGIVDLVKWVRSRGRDTQG